MKSTLRLLIPRLRNAQKKDTALSIASRREMADLLSSSREASARIRVENIIATDITVELMEILELYAELLLARAGLLDVRDKNIKDGIIAKDAADETGLEEAAASIIYSAPRLPRDVRELGQVRAMLIERFGKDFAVKANENADNLVPTRVTEKLRVDPPKAVLVEAYLSEIARTYGVEWPKHRQEDEEMEDLDREVHDEDDGGADGSDGVGGGSKEQPLLASAATPQKQPRNLNLGTLQSPSSLEPGGAKSPVSVAPPAPRSDNLSPKVKLPGGGEVGRGREGGPVNKHSESKKDSTTGAGTGAAAKKGAENKNTTGAGVVGGKVPTVDDLAKRFQMLKR